MPVCQSRYGAKVRWQRPANSGTWRTLNYGDGEVNTDIGVLTSFDASTGTVVLNAAGPAYPSLSAVAVDTLATRRHTSAFNQLHVSEIVMTQQPAAGSSARHGFGWCYGGQTPADWEAGNAFYQVNATNNRSFYEVLNLSGSTTGSRASQPYANSSGWVFPGEFWGQTMSVGWQACYNATTSTPTGRGVPVPGSARLVGVGDYYAATWYGGANAAGTLQNALPNVRYALYAPNKWAV